MPAIDILLHNSLALELKEVFIGQLVLVQDLLKPGFCYHNSHFQIGIKANEEINPTRIKDYIQLYGPKIFISKMDFERLENKLNERLIKLTRSLSIGEPLVNSTKQVQLLSLNMANLYLDPLNELKLVSQFKNSANLALFLINNKEIQKSLFNEIKKQKHHFTISQPLLSSVFLISFLQYLNIFSEKELQGLFLTSYFKDLGISFAPQDVLNKEKLNSFEKNTFTQHPLNTLAILEGKVGLSKSHLNIIKNHHFLSHRQKGENEGTQIYGIETTLIATADILIAMMSERPYRQSVKLFNALEEIKGLIADDYPQEFKALITYIRYFFT
jgi:HD-GYP domain-containing protein (c-di-GMP phosphodiesterase class II)